MKPRLDPHDIAPSQVNQRDAGQPRELDNIGRLALSGTSMGVW